MAQQKKCFVSVECGSDEITIRSKIEVHQKPDQIFHFLSNMQNDPLWRSEIISCESSANGVISQFSGLSRRLKNYRQDYQIINSDTVSRSFHAQSLKENRYQQQSWRRVEVSEQNQLWVIYEISFDRGIIREALGYDIPDFLIRFQMKRVSRKYLKKLKQILENQS